MSLSTRTYRHASEEEQVRGIENIAEALDGKNFEEILSWVDSRSYAVNKGPIWIGGGRVLWVETGDIQGVPVTLEYFIPITHDIMADGVEASNKFNACLSRVIADEDGLCEVVWTK